MAVVGRIEGTSRATGQAAGPEIDDPELRNVKLETAELVVCKPVAVGKTLRQLGERFGGGSYLIGGFRAGQPMPITPGVAGVLRGGTLLPVLVAGLVVALVPAAGA